ncbi:PP0621 family protein [Pseudomonas sp. SDO528_S397]
MVRLLFWIAVIAAAVWFWRKFKSPPAQGQRPAEPGPTPMVRCAHCGVHLPQDRALSQRQEWYCTQAHLEQGPKSIQR